ncbi:MAG: sugar phosphate nucleotidyltransferase [Anaerolineales bacterium]
MKVIIPLAGFGTRLRPHTFSKPKPLINVAGKPVLGHLMDMFTGLDIEEFIFITGYLGEQIEEYLGSRYPALTGRYFEQRHLNGQSPAVLLAKDYVDGPILIGFADTIIETDLAQLKDEPADAVAWVKRVDDPRRFGVAVVGDDGYVKRLIEKPDTKENNLVVVGFYYLKDGPALMRAIVRQIGDDIQTKGEYYLADAMQLLLDEGLQMRVEEVEVWQDCGKPETVLQTNRHLLENGHDNSASVQADGFIVIPPVNIHPSAHIKNSVIGPLVTIGENCQIEYSIIRDSIIEAGAQIKDAVLAQSLVGRAARVKGRYRTFNVGDESELGFE